MVTVGPEHRALADALGARATWATPLGPLSTYGVGGPTAVLVEVEGTADLDDLRAALRGGEWATLVVGRGSNLLVADAGFDGVAVHLGSGGPGLGLPDDEDVQAGERAEVTAGGSLALPVLARRVADAGWSGLSWAVGVP